MINVWVIQLGYFEFVFDEQDNQLQILDRRDGKMVTHDNLLTDVSQLIYFARGYVYCHRDVEGK